MSATTVVAVDFGATSVRVCRVDLDGAPLAVEVVHRYHHRPVTDRSGHFRWDWNRLVAEMDKGLHAATEAGDVGSIGIDTWAADYGLLDANDDLIARPFCYRDHRTDGYRRVVDRIGERRLYEICGLQLQPFNTIFQLAVHTPAELRRAAHVLMLPELLVHHLTGTITCERTSAGSTGLVDLSTGDWSPELVDAIDLDPALLSPISNAGSHAGQWNGIPVHLVGGHDTASAVNAMATLGLPGAAFISGGTWLLVGAERADPDLSDTARARNFTNEQGTFGGIRLLRNLPGAWLIESSRPKWGNPVLTELLTAASELPAGPTIDLTNPDLLHPENMVATITQAAGMSVDADPATVTRCIVDSMAHGIATAFDQLGDITHAELAGGLSKWTLLHDELERVSGIPIVAGPTEATALGNAVAQGLALGCYDSLADARSIIREHSTPQQRTST